MSVSQYLAVFTLGGAVLAGSHARAEDLLSAKDFLKAGLEGSAKMTKEVFALSGAQKEELVALAPKATETAFTFYFGRNADGKLKRACTIVPQQGKEGPMTLGVCFDGAGVVQQVRVLTYQEERGKPVKEEAFLSQFTGKASSAEFRLGKDVDGVSGATYSSTAVAEAVRKSAFAYKKFVQSK